MIDRRKKLKKQHWLEHPKTVPKITKFGPKCKLFQMSCLEVFFSKYYFRHIKILYWFKCSSGHQSFFNIRFSNRKSQSQQKLAKKVTNFTLHFRSKASLILRTSPHLTLKIRCSLNTAKALFDFEIFQQTCFCFVPEKNICTASFLDALVKK